MSHEPELARDLEALRGWWAALLERDPPPDSVVALWFGLFESADGGVTLYVHGFDAYDPDDPDAQWATIYPSWEPQGRYVRVPTLAEADEWSKALERGLLLVTSLSAHETFPHRLQGIGAGFDEGDAYSIWRASPMG